MTTTTSRLELYEDVWKRPVKFVAKDLSVAAGTLARICQRNSIPVPARGHWSRVEAGYVVVPDPLPNPHRDATIEIKKHAPRDARRRRPRQPATCKPSTDDTNGLTLASQAVKQFHAESLKRRLLHELNDGTTVLRIAERTQFNVCITRGSAARTVRILDSLCMLAEIAEIEIRPSDSGLSFIIASNYVPIAVSEKIGRSDGTICGQLEILLDSQHRKDGIRRRFADSERRPLEALLSEVITSVVLCAKAAASCEPKFEEEEEIEIGHLVDEWASTIEELARIIAIAHSCQRRMSKIRVDPEATYERRQKLVRVKSALYAKQKEFRALNQGQRTSGAGGDQ